MTPRASALLTGVAFAAAVAATLRERRTAAQLEAARRHAYRDVLTGLHNRAGLAHTWRTRRHAVTAVAVIDLDGFKPVNDQHGHQAGDHLLAVIANRLNTAPGVAARLGGDEFAILLTTDDPAGAARILAADIAIPVALPTGDLVRVTGSIGLAPVTGQDLAAALGDADAAMYRAKTTRAGVAVYAPNMDDHPVPAGRPAVRVRDLITTNLTPGSLR